MTLRFLRALRALLAEAEAKPLATIHLPITDSDGDRGWLEMRYAPLPDELAWAFHPSESMREAFAVLAVSKARGAVEHGTDAKVGWTPEEG